MLLHYYKIQRYRVEYLLSKIVRFEHIFPKSSTSYWKENHYRTYRLANRLKHHFYRVMPPKNIINYDKVINNSIPVLIVNSNRCQTLMQMVDWLLQLDDAVSIIILDNASTYPPLLNYYDSLDYPNVQVKRFKKNHKLNKLTAISQTLQQYQYYVLTDADLVPYAETKINILGRMKMMLEKYQDVNHIGASLGIDDIPDHYPLKNAVQKWEGKFWTHPREEGVFEACVDTTFAMYRSNSYVMEFYPSLRLGKNYSLKHVDWYVDPSNLSHENEYNMAATTNVSTWNTRLKNCIPGL